MAGARRPDLTIGQRECLRLVKAQYTSKEIARQLGISPFTVDQRLDAARKKLNATSRADAARRFALMDAENIYQPLVYDPLRLENTTILPHSTDALSASEGVDQKNSFSQINVSDNTSFVAAGSDSQTSSWFTPPPFGGERHELSNGDILLKTINVAFISTMMIAVMVIVITGVMRLF
jgi:DNA-binding CsgD family transcriptional regulator